MPQIIGYASSSNNNVFSEHNKKRISLEVSNEDINVVSAWIGQIIKYTIISICVYE